MSQHTGAIQPFPEKGMVLRAGRGRERLVSGMRQSWAFQACPAQPLVCPWRKHALSGWGLGGSSRTPAEAWGEMHGPGGTQTHSHVTPWGLLTGKEFTKFQLSFWVRKCLMPQLRMI